MLIIRVNILIAKEILSLLQIFMLERLVEGYAQHSLTNSKYRRVLFLIQLKLSRAVGLAVADIGGASDPFAVIELGNQRLITPTIYKTLNPQWDKSYEL